MPLRKPTGRKVINPLPPKRTPITSEQRDLLRKAGFIPSEAGSLTEAERESAKEACKTYQEWLARMLQEEHGKSGEVMKTLKAINDKMDDYRAAFIRASEFSGVDKHDGRPQGGASMTIVRPTTSKFDEQGFADKHRKASWWSKVTSEIVDKKKLAQAMKSSESITRAVAQFTEESDGTPYVRPTFGADASQQKGAKDSIPDDDPYTG